MKITLMMAMTADGKIGKDRDHFPDWTGTADKRMFARLSREAGVVIMGSKTFDTIGKPLPERKNVILSRNPERRSRWDNLVFSAEKPVDILRGLSEEGYSDAILAGGALINRLFAEAGLIDELILTVSPKIFGNGLSLFDGDVQFDLTLNRVEQIDEGSVCLTYSVRK
jgi:dihydrofolate reductase